MHRLCHRPYVIASCASMVSTMISVDACLPTWKCAVISAITPKWTKIRRSPLWRIVMSGPTTSCFLQVPIQSFWIQPFRSICILSGYVFLFCFCVPSFADIMGRPNKVKFYDYQLIAYKSVVQDLIFFLFTSCNEAVRMQNIEAFFKHYHNHFYKTLKLLKCPLDDYTYEKYARTRARSLCSSNNLTIPIWFGH